jgi:hypothetical protein
MPAEGNRIPVKLPFKGISDGKDQFVSMKSTVADFLGLGEATEAELEYKTTIKKKGEGSGSVTIKRRRRPGYRQRSVKITFRTGRPAATGRPSTLAGKKQKVGNKTYASIQFPITKSCGMTDIIEWFEAPGQKKLGVLTVTDVTTGQSYPLRGAVRSKV